MIKKLLAYSLIFLLTIQLAQSLNSRLVSENNNSGPSIQLPLNHISDRSLVYAALPNQTRLIKTSLKTADARPEIIRQYLEKYHSPLVPYAELLVQVADENNMDYRWMVAIAQQESNLCKKIPPNSYNCWGWGIYGDKVTRFDSYEHAITNIAPQFKDKFLGGSFDADPFAVMQTYTPPSQGSWANGVLQFFSELE